MGNQYLDGHNRWVKPQFRDSALSNHNGSTITGSLALQVPALTQRGDIMVALFATNSDAVTPASGWTLFEHGAGTATVLNGYLYWRVATPADEGGGKTYTWTISGSNASPTCALALSFEGCDSSRTSSAIGAEVTTGTSLTSPSVGTPGGPAQRIHFAVTRSGTGTAITHSWGSGCTKVEAFAQSSVSYTASAAVEDGLTYGGAGGGRSNTASASTTDTFEFQVALGAAPTPGIVLPNLNTAMRSSL